MNKPCARADITRAIRSTVIPVDNDARVLPAIKTNMIASSNVLRDIADVSDVRIGAPNITPRAYMVTVSPAEDTLI
ncbi:hypothetical protein D3C75_1281370 [compost metagenome]